MLETQFEGRGRSTLAFLVVVLILGVAFGRFVVQDFGGPLLGRGDRNLWVHQADYFARNLKWLPLPHLDLVNDQLAYPYTMDNVFMPWVMEMHAASALCTWWTGEIGPWEQIYYLLTVLLTAVGAYLLLLRDHGAGRAALAAIVVSFCNYYSIGKFPGHMSIAVVHWTTLGILADFVLVRRFVTGQVVSAPLVAARLSLVLLGLGQGLGYVCGIGLTSFLVCVSYLLGVVVVRAGGRPRAVMTSLRAELRRLLCSAREHRLAVAVASIPGVLAAWFMLPLAVQVAVHARQFDFSDLPMGAWWVDPMRFFMPLLPGLSRESMMNAFADRCEGVFAASPGLALVLAGALGLVFADRRTRHALWPFAFLTLAMLSFDPRSHHLLSALPWFGFARVSGKLSGAYSVLLVVLALGIPRPLSGRWLRGAMALVGLLFVIEAYSAYDGHLTRPKINARFDPELVQLMETIRTSPGEALLEWPFLVSAGNGLRDLWPGRPARLKGASVLQVAHRKKIMGMVYGRLHPSQVQPYLDDGWPRLFNSQRLGRKAPSLEPEGFSAEEWEFFEDFFKSYDFCGLMLYKDLLHPSMIEEFHRRFGAPIRQAHALRYGSVEFIPRPAHWQVGRSRPDHRPRLGPP